MIPRTLFNLYVILSAFFICNAVIAEFIGVKIFSVERLFGLIGQRGEPGRINMSIGVIIWPFVFLTTDIMNEYFGKKGVRRISFITAGLIAYASVIVIAGTRLPPAQFWLDANASDAAGNAFDINFAYHKIFRQGVGIVIGSVTAFLVSQMIDVYVFHFFRGLTGHRLLWVRATGSTIVSQVIDSFLILFIAFYLLGNWTMGDVLSVGVVQYFYKVGLAVILTPLIYVAHSYIDKYLGRKFSEEVIDNVNEHW